MWREGLHEGSRKQRVSLRFCSSCQIASCGRDRRQRPTTPDNADLAYELDCFRSVKALTAAAAI